MQKVFIARHGERADFVDKDWVTTAEARCFFLQDLNPVDPPLTERGLQQAGELGQRLKGEQIRCIYASPFLRAVQTAHQVAQAIGVAVQVEPGLSEGLLPRLFPKGPPHFRTPAQLHEALPLVDAAYQPLWQLSFPEDYKDSRARCAAVVQALVQRHADENIMLVGHGLSVEYLAVALVPDEPCSLHIPYCCLTECIRQSGSTTWHYGAHMDASFLSQPQSRTAADEQRAAWGLHQEPAVPV